MNPDSHETTPLAGDPKTTGHVYDGIQEFDNPTPGWWVALFIATVFFAIGYAVYYHAPVPDRSVYDGFDADVAADLKKRFAGMGKLEITQANMLQWMEN